jgi:hypothetical protein
LTGTAKFSAAELPASLANVLGREIRGNTPFGDTLRTLPPVLGSGNWSSERPSPITRQWELSITNQGRKKLTGVRVKSLQAVEARITREDGAQRDTVISGVVIVGDLAPNETAAVRLWLPGSFSEFLRSEEPQLTHDDGVRSVLILREVGSVGQWLDNVWKPFVYTVLIWLVWRALYLVAYSSDHGEREKQDVAPAK